jgi:glutathione S-transferase
MLAHKGVEYKQVNLPPGAHAFIMLGLRFQTMTVPALKVDGRRVQGSRYIARFLDELVPERPLFPADPERRRAVEEAERWGEQFQNAVRRVFYCMSRRDSDAFKKLMLAERSLPMRAMLRVSAPTVIWLATAKHDAVDAAGEVDVAELPARMDQIDAWIEQGILDGPELNAADFQIGVNVAALLLTEDGAPYIVGRPAEALARRVAPDYTGSVGKALPTGMIPKILPPEWLPPVNEQPTAKPSGARGAHIPGAA